MVLSPVRNPSTGLGPRVPSAFVVLCQVQIKPPEVACVILDLRGCTAKRTPGEREVARVAVQLDLPVAHLHSRNVCGKRSLHPILRPVPLGETSV